MTFDLRAVSSGVTRMEYRIGNDSWSEVDMDSLQIQIPSPEANSTLRLNLYGKKKKPIATYDYWYNNALGTWVQGVPTTETVVSASSSKAEVVAPPVETVEPVSIPEATVAASESMTFDLRSVSSGVTRIEYRLGNGSWSDMDMNSLQIQIPRPKADSTLQLNLYGKKKKPIATYDYRYDVALGTWIHGDQAAVRAAATEAVVPASSVKEEAVAIAKGPVEVPVTSTETVVPATPIKEEVVVAPPAKAAEPVSIPEATVAASKPMTFDLRAVSSGVTRMEYRLGNEPWCDVDMDCLQIQIPSHEADSTLSLNLYGKKKKPIATYDYRYDVALGTWIHGDQATVRAAATEAVVPASTAAVAESVTPAEKEMVASPESVAPASSVEATMSEASIVPMEAASSQDAAPMPPDFWILDLNAFDSEVVRIEYRFSGDDAWRDVDMESLLIPLPDPDTETNLQLRMHVKNKRSVM